MSSDSAVKDTKSSEEETPSDTLKTGSARSSDSDANYSNEALQEIFEGSDAKLDDPELINKKALI